MDNEQQLMEILAAAGASKAKAFEALACVRRRDYAGAHDSLAEAKRIDHKAHDAQTQLIAASLTGEAGECGAGLLAIHAQDHYMTSQLARDLAEAIVAIFEQREED